MSDIPRVEPVQANFPSELVIEALNRIEKLYLNKFKIRHLKAPKRGKPPVPCLMICSVKGKSGVDVAGKLKGQSLKRSTTKTARLNIFHSCILVKKRH